MLNLRNWMVVLLLGALSSPAAYAGDSRGSGGYIIVCKNPETSELKVELLDFYEGREFRGFELEFGDEAVSWMDKIEYVLGALGEVDPKRALRYRAEARRFKTEAIWKANIQLVPSGDSFHLALPENCTAEQAVTHREPVFPEDYRYLVSDKWWSLLDENGRAGLILHEILFRETREHGQTDSVRARYFNSLLCSTRFKEFDEPMYRQRLKLVGLPFTE